MTAAHASETGPLGPVFLYLLECYTPSMNEHDFVVGAVREAGELLMRLRIEHFETLSKGKDPRDIVTSVDLAVNKLLIEKIKDAFPHDAIYSEEGGGDVLAAPRLWTIDPIDGSSNFSRGIPHFSICLALLEAGIPMTGAVYNPVTNELFSFKRGGGAFLNGAPVRVSEVGELKDAFVLLHAGRKKELQEWGGQAYTELLKHAKKTSNLAGSALDMCFVAAGRIEADIYGTASLLDIAAAVGILHEAGGVIVGADGAELPLVAEPALMIAANSRSIADAVRVLL